MNIYDNIELSESIIFKSVNPFISSKDQSGINQSSNPISIKSGLSTGSAGGGNINFDVSLGSSSGSSQNIRNTVFSIQPSDSRIVIENVNLGINTTNTTHLLSLEGNGNDDLIKINDSNLGATSTIFSINENGEVNSRDGYNLITPNGFIEKVVRVLEGTGGHPRSTLILGDGGLNLNVTTTDSVLIGNDAANAATNSPQNCVLIGNKASYLTSTLPSDTISIGFIPLKNITGTFNIGIGSDSGRNLTSAYKNVLIGHYSGRSLVSNSNRSVFIGQESAGYSNSGNENVLSVKSTIIGYRNYSFSTINRTITNSIMIGSDSQLNSDTDITDTIMLGSNINTTSFTTFSNSIVLGYNNTIDHNDCILLGSGNNSTADSQLQIGGPQAPINSFYIGRGSENTISDSVKISLTDLKGATNSDTGDLIISSGKSTGTGKGGDISFEVAPEGATSGTTQNNTNKLFSIKSSNIESLTRFVQFAPNGEIPDNLLSNESYSFYLESNSLKAKYKDSIGATSILEIEENPMKPWSIKVRNSGTSGEPTNVDETDITTETSTSGDFVFGWNGSGNIRKFDVNDFLSGGPTSFTFAYKKEGAISNGNVIDIGIPIPFDLDIIDISINIELSTISVAGNLPVLVRELVTSSAGVGFALTSSIGSLKRTINCSLSTGTSYNRTFLDTNISTGSVQVSSGNLLFIAIGNPSFSGTVNGLIVNIRAQKQ